MVVSIFVMKNFSILHSFTNIVRAVDHELSSCLGDKRLPIFNVSCI